MWCERNNTACTRNDMFAHTYAQRRKPKYECICKRVFAYVIVHLHMYASVVKCTLECKAYICLKVYDAYACVVVMCVSDGVCVRVCTCVRVHVFVFI